MGKESQTERLPPHDRAAERAVLGAMLRNNDVIGDVHAAVKKEDFYMFPSQAVYAAIMALFTAGQVVDVVTVCDYLGVSQGKTDEGLDARFVADLWDAASSPSEAIVYAKVVRSQSTMRELLRVANHIQQNAWNGSRAAPDVLSEVEKMVFDTSNIRQDVSSVHLRRVLLDAAQNIEDQQRRKATSGIPIGLIDLDTITGGFHQGELVIVAARPSVGKTAFGLQCFIGCGANDIPALFFSLEQSKQELAERIFCMRGGINSKTLRSRHISASDGEKIMEVVDSFTTSSLYVCDTPGLSMAQILSESRRVKLRSGIKAIFVDYLQLIEPDNRRSRREEQVAAISKRLKFIARELQVPVIAMAQLNRNADGQRPKLSDLRESGSQEQDADAVYMLHDPDQLKPEHERRGIIEVLVLKNRNGPRGDATLLYVGHNMRFENYAQERP